MSDIITIGSMVIDKKKDLPYIWYEDDCGNVVKPSSDTEDLCMSSDPEIRAHAKYYHTMFPLDVREKIMKFTPGVNEDDSPKYEDIMSFRTSIGSDDLVLAMVESGDFKLGEAILVVAKSCERCLNVLRNHYLPYSDDPGYELFSDEWKNVNTSCNFCDNLIVPTKSYTKKPHETILNQFWNWLCKKPSVTKVTNIPPVAIKFELGKYYKHTDGTMLHICGRACSDIYYNPCLVAEDANGNISFVGDTVEYAENYHEISKDEFLKDETSDDECLNNDPM